MNIKKALYDCYFYLDVTLWYSDIKSFSHKWFNTSKGFRFQAIYATKHAHNFSVKVSYVWFIFKQKYWVKAGLGNF